MIKAISKIQIVKELLRYSPTKIVSILVGIFSFKFYTEVFSTKEYGIYNLILATFSLITVFLTGWMGYVLIRFFEKHRKEDSLDSFLSTICSVLVILLGILMLIGLSAIALFFQVQYLYWLALLSLPLTIISSLLVTYYQLNQEVGKYNLVNLATGLGVFVVFLIVYYIFQLKLAAFFLATIFLNFIVVLIGFSDLRKRKISFNIDKNQLIDYLKYGLPQVGTGIGVVLLSTTSRYFIQYFDGTESVGVFSAAFKFGELSILLPLGIFTGIFSPYIFREFEQNGEEKALQLILNYKTLYILCFGPIVVLLSLFPNLAAIFLGSDFKSSLLIIPIICLGNFMFGYSQFVGLHTQLHYKPGIITFSVLLAVIANVILNLLLMPTLGIRGAAYATVITYLIYTITLIIKIKVPIKQIPLGGFLALLLTGFIVNVISNIFLNSQSPVILNVLLSLSIWVILFFFMIAFRQIKLPITLRTD